MIEHRLRVVLFHLDAWSTEKGNSMQRRYKFTNAGRRARHGFSDYPSVGEWSESRRPVMCRSGWHVPTAEGMPRWLASELWEVEVDGVSVSQDNKESWERVRFVRQVGEWTPAVAAEFAAACRDRASEHANADAARYADAGARYAARYAADAPAERRWQSEWLRTRLNLD